MSKRFMILALVLAMALAAVTAQAQMLAKKQFSAARKRPTRCIWAATKCAWTSPAAP